MIVQEPVQAAIWHCLNHYDHKDAIFLAERLCTEVETDETIFILATSYYRSNLIHQAYWILKEKSRRTPQCRFLLAKCAYQLKKFSEAECILYNGGFGDSRNFDEIAKDFGEIACFVFQLLAQICLQTERIKIAAEALRKALKLNPFMWQAFADLCHMGEQVDAFATFTIPSTDVFNTCQGNTHSDSMILYDSTNAVIDRALFNNHTTLNAVSTNAPTVPATDGVVNHINNSSNSILSTPTEQHVPVPLQDVTQSHPQGQPNSQHTHTHNNSIMALQNLNTPNNNNLNNTMPMLRGNTNGQSIINQNSSIAPLDDTPLGYTDEQTQTGHTAAHTIELVAGTPFRKQFKYLSTISPTTPSFGILPISSPCSAESPAVGVNSVGHTQMPFNSTNSTNSTNSPSPQTLAEVNQGQKIAKKMKSHISSLISRKDHSSITTSHRPAVFTQTGNITPRTPNNIGSGVPLPSAAVRRSSRLFSNTAYSVKENNKSPNITNKFLQPRSPSRKTKSRMAKICLNNDLIQEKSSNTITDKLHEKNSMKFKDKVETITSGTGVHRRTEDTKVLLNNSLNNAQKVVHHVLTLKKQSADGLMTLLRDLGEGFKNMAQYKCKAAITHLETTVPKHHLCSSWVQSIIALSYYELRDYESAVVIFKRVHEIDPYRLECMEIYSTSLWQLQKEVDLSALAQDVINQSRTSPVTWCVAGNCFSLHKEHETAIKFFKRAVQVDPEFVYSYTLLGHELVLTEELDKALDHFRSAVVRDPRHYNAWFGIGTIYSKQEKYELAELHYIKALKIYPQNSVILVHIGAMQCFMQKKELALQTLNTAATLDPKNPLARFHRGSIYFSLGKNEAALEELEELKEIVPKESVVFYLIGKIHKALGNVDLALMHFSWATDLDPKGANNQVKDAFDSMSHPNCCPATAEPTLETEHVEPVSERSEDSTQAQQEVNYESDY